MLVKIEQVVSFGFKISFSVFQNQLHIRLEKDGEGITQCLPLREDHINEDKVQKCIDYMLNMLLSQRVQDSYQGVSADDVLYKYRDGQLYWHGKDKIPVTLQEMDITRLKRTKTWLEKNEDIKNEAVKKWIVCFSNEINLRMLKDFKTT